MLEIGALLGFLVLGAMAAAVVGLFIGALKLLGLGLVGLVALAVLAPAVGTVLLVLALPLLFVGSLVWGVVALARAV